MVSGTSFDTTSTPTSGRFNWASMVTRYRQTGNRTDHRRFQSRLGSTKSNRRCERCRGNEAQVPFDWILADILSKQRPYEFVLSEVAYCPNVVSPVFCHPTSMWRKNSKD